jgi:hypothetical protein
MCSSVVIEERSGVFTHSRGALFAFDLSKALSMTDTTEGRSKPRTYTEFPIEVRGRDERGLRFKLRSVAENMSSTGVYFRTSEPIRSGAKLFLVVRLGADNRIDGPGLGVAANAEVVRVDEKPQGGFGIAAEFSHYRLLMNSSHLR